MLPSVLSDAEDLYRERIKELFDLNFKDKRLMDKVLDQVISDEPKVNVFGGKEASFMELLKHNAAAFIGDLKELEDFAGNRKDTMTDAKRRAGEFIVDHMYRSVSSSLWSRAREQADKEFSGLKDKRWRFDDAISKIRKSNSQDRRAKIAALYAFEEERMQYDDDVSFSECCSDEHFKRHIQAVLKRSHPEFDINDAVEKARALMTSGKMKGKNFRKRNDAT